MLLLLLLLLGGLFVLFATPAQAVPITIKLNQQPSYYQIAALDYTDLDGHGRPKPINFAGDVFEWDTAVIASPTEPGKGPFHFTVLYDKTRFHTLETLVDSSLANWREVGTTAEVDPYNTGTPVSYTIYEISNASSYTTIYAKLYCQIDLAIRGGLNAEFKNTALSHPKVEHGTTFLFTVATEAFIKPIVQQYNKPNDPSSNIPDDVLEYDTLDTAFPDILMPYRFYYSTKVTGNMTIYIDDLMDVYLVTLPDNDDANPDSYATVPGSGLHLVEFSNDPANPIPFKFIMRFTRKYATSVPYASVVGDNNLICSWVSAGNRTWEVTVPQPTEKKALTITFDKQNWIIVQNGITIQKNPSYYTVNPEEAYLQVYYDESAVFYLIPTPAYAHNTKAPTFSFRSGGGYSVIAVHEGSQWKCTIVGVKDTLDVDVNISQWTADPNAPSGDVSIITMPSGQGYSIGNILGGYGLGNNQYRVNNGDDFIFSVNVLSGYDASTLNVSVAGQRLFPENGVYTIPKVNASLAVTITVDQISTSTPTPTPTGGTGSPGGTNGNGNGEDDGSELKYREVYDEKSGVMVAGFFVGIPEIVVTELFKTDPVYIRMQSTANVADDKILRAVDVQIKNATSYGTITLGLQVGVGYNTIEMLVVHATSMGDETFTVLGQDGMATVAVRHTSPFMVADPYGRGTGSNGNGSNGSGNTGGILPPATGGARSIMGFVLIAIVICSVLFIIWYRGRDPKPKAEATEE